MHTPNPFFRRAVLALVLLAALCAANFAPAARAQTKADLERDRNRGRAMLSLVKDYMKEFYYDPKYRGMDLEARFKAADAKIGEAQSLSQVLGVIAQALAELNDSHTFFIPPPRPVDVDYGWKMQAVGERVYVTAVKPGSDAEAQGLKPGDEVLSVDGFRPTRPTLWKIEYNYNVLRPSPGKRVVVRAPDGTERELALKAKVEKLDKSVNLTQLFNEYDEDREDSKKLPRYYEEGAGADGVFIWKLREFGFTESKVDEMISKARKHKALVLDLRGNGGGAVKTLQRMLGYVFDRDIKVGEVKKRKETKQLVAKTRGGEKVFKGTLVVLVDSESGSASEVFARVVQLEKRGTVVGDLTAGAVMMSTQRPGLLGDQSSGNMIQYGLSVTEADIIMADGQSLEHMGVKPDVVLLPTAEDLRVRRDPVLARAVELAGGRMAPEKAGLLFPPEVELKSTR
ncbi:MAG: S41 family peptidase [Pyrinomonadaceae bacterium]